MRQADRGFFSLALMSSFDTLTLVTQAYTIIDSLYQESLEGDSQNRLCGIGYLQTLADIHQASPGYLLEQVASGANACERQEAKSHITALPLALSCVSLSERYNLQRQYFQSISTLAEILLQFRLYEQALQMIEDIMPLV
jgi:hypothetical protein